MRYASFICCKEASDMTKLIDLTAEMYDGAPTMPMDPKLSISWHCNLDTLGYNLSRVTTSTHQGTHFDSPRHFFYDGQTIDKISLERCVTLAFKVDLTAKKPGEPITVADIEPYADKIEAGLAVLLHTGWDKVFPKDEFFNDFPVVSRELAEWFARKKTKLVGMDMPTPNGKDWKYIHETMLGNDVLIIEGLANMEELAAGEEFTLIALPLRLKDRDGSPIRAVAMVD